MVNISQRSSDYIKNDEENKVQTALPDADGRNTKLRGTVTYDVDGNEENLIPQKEETQARNDLNNSDMEFQKDSSFKAVRDPKLNIEMVDMQAVARSQITGPTHLNINNAQK